MVKLALNNRESTVTEKLPFYTNFGRHPNLFNMLRESPKADTVMGDDKDLERIYEKMIKKHRILAQMFKIYH